MSRNIPDRARGLAAGSTDDRTLATELNDAQRWLRRANDRLWSGLRPDGMAVLYGECATAVDVAAAQNRSEILSAPEPLREIQGVHWTINRAFGDCQAAAERRRQLAAEIGELAGELIATLVGAGWSERDAREANVNEVACASNTGEEEVTGS